jgi:hypothetical protein
MVGCKVENPGIQRYRKGNIRVLAKLNKAKFRTFAVKLLCVTGKKLDIEVIWAQLFVGYCFITGYKSIYQKYDQGQSGRNQFWSVYSHKKYI